MTYSGMRWEKDRQSLFGTNWDPCAVDQDLTAHIWATMPDFPWVFSNWSWDAAVDDDVEFLQRGRHDV